MKKITACECAVPGWCERHKMTKSRVTWLACQRDQALFDFLERGPQSEIAIHPSPSPLPPCQHRGTDIVDQIPCELCGNRTVLVPIFACVLHERCAERRIGNRTEVARTMPACTSCSDYLPVPDLSS